MFKARLAALALAPVLALGFAGAALADSTPPVFSTNQSGVEATGSTYEYVQTVFTIPTVTPPNDTTSLAVYLSDATQSVVLSVGPLEDPATGNYSASLTVEDPTPGEAPGYTTGYTDGNASAYAAGDKVELSESYDTTTGQLTYTVIDLTNDTVAVWSSQFTDLGQSFTTAFAGPLFSADVYTQPTAWTQPTAKTELAEGTHTLIEDTTGTDVTSATKVKTAAGGSSLGVKLTSVSTGTAGKNFTVYLLPPS